MLIPRQLKYYDFMIISIFTYFLGFIVFLKWFSRSLTLLNVIRFIWKIKLDKKYVNYGDINFRSGDLIFFSYNKQPLSLEDLYLTRGIPLLTKFSAWYHVGLVINIKDNLYVTEFRRDVDKNDASKYGVGVILTPLIKRIKEYNGIVGHRSINLILNEKENYELFRRIQILYENNIKPGTNGFINDFFDRENDFVSFIPRLRQNGLFCGSYLKLLLYDTNIRTESSLPANYAYGNNHVWRELNMIKT